MQKKAAGPDALATWMRKTAADPNFKLDPGKLTKPPATRKFNTSAGEVEVEMDTPAAPFYEGIKNAIGPSEYLPGCEWGRMKGKTDLETIDHYIKALKNNALAIYDKETGKHANKWYWNLANGIGNANMYRTSPHDQGPVDRLTAAAAYLDGMQRGPSNQRNTFTAQLQSLEAARARLTQGLTQYAYARRAADTLIPAQLAWRMVGAKGSDIEILPGMRLPERDVSYILSHVYRDVYNNQLKDFTWQRAHKDNIVPDPSPTAWSTFQYMDPDMLKAYEARFAALSDKVGANLLAKNEYGNIEDSIAAKILGYDQKPGRLNYDMQPDFSRLNPEEQREYLDLLVRIPYARDSNQYHDHVNNVALAMGQQYLDKFTGIPLNSAKYLYRANAWSPEDAPANNSAYNAFGTLGALSRFFVAKNVAGNPALQAAAWPGSNLLKTMLDPSLNFAYFTAAGLSGAAKDRLPDSKPVAWLGDFLTAMNNPTIGPVVGSIHIPPKLGNTVVGVAPVAAVAPDAAANVLSGIAVREGKNALGVPGAAIAQELVGNGVGNPAEDAAIQELSAAGVDNPTREQVDTVKWINSEAGYKDLADGTAAKYNGVKGEEYLADLTGKVVAGVSSRAMDIPDAFLADASIPAVNKLQVCNAKVIVEAAALYEPYLSNFGQKGTIGKFFSFLGGKEGKILEDLKNGKLDFSDANTATAVRTLLNDAMNRPEGAELRKGVEAMFSVLGKTLSDPNLTDDQLQALLGSTGASSGLLQGADLVDLASLVPYSVARNMLRSAVSQDMPADRIYALMNNLGKVFDMKTGGKSADGAKVLDSMPGIRQAIVDVSSELLLRDSKVTGKLGAMLFDKATEIGAWGGVADDIMKNVGGKINGEEAAMGFVEHVSRRGDVLGKFIHETDPETAGNGFLKHLPEAERKKFMDTMQKLCKEKYMDYALHHGSEWPRACAIMAKMYGMQSLSKYLADPMVFWPAAFALLGVTGIALSALFGGDDDDDEEDEEKRSKGPGIDYEALGMAMANR